MRRWNMLQKQPWHKLSQLLGARGVKADWTGFPDKLLKPTNDLAETHPCSGRCGGYMDVVKHSDGTYVGVCASGCDKRTLQKKDLIVYSPDFTTIFSSLAQAFSINGAGHTEIDGLPAWQIGEYNPVASYRFPVVAMIEAQTSRIERAIGQLAARYKNPFFVLLSSAPAVTQSVQDVALRNGAKVFAYEDLIEFANDAIQVRGNAASILSELAAGWIKHIDPASGEHYPTPPGATWGDIVLEFTANEAVTVSCRNKDHRQYSAEDFQMRDKRTNAKKPTKAWTFLQALAMVNGNMAVDDITKVDKTKQEVSAKLKSLFQLTDDPIEWSSEDTAYKARFIIRGGSKITVAGKRQKTAAA